MYDTYLLFAVAVAVGHSTDFVCAHPACNKDVDIQKVTQSLGLEALLQLCKKKYIYNYSRHMLNETCGTPLTV